MRLDFRLSDVQRDLLIEAMTHSPSIDIQRRAYALWLLHLGVSVTEVARRLELRSRRTIYNWFHQFQAGGLDGLGSKPRAHRPNPASETLGQILDEIVEDSPRRRGYMASGWTVSLLTDELKKQTGTSLSERRVRKLLKRRGYTYGGQSDTNAPLQALPSTVQEWRTLAQSMVTADSAPLSACTWRRAYPQEL